MLEAQKDLRDIAADWRGEAAVLRKRGDERAAQLLEQCAHEATSAAADFVQWLSEEEAALRSGWARAKVRRHARLYATTPHVQFEKRQYRLRACIVPRRCHPEMLRASAGRTQ